MGAAPGGRLGGPPVAVLAAGRRERRDRDGRAAARRRGRGRPGRAAVERRRAVGRQVQGAGVRRVGHHHQRAARPSCTASSTPPSARWRPTAAWWCWAPRRRTPPRRREHTAQRALEGFTRSLGKEMRGGGTVQLVYVEQGAEQPAGLARCASCSRPSRRTCRARWCASARPACRPTIDWEKPLDGKVALVTGASRGIGAAIAAVLARDGAHVVGLDIPALGDDLRTVTSELGGSALEVDVTDADAPKTDRRPPQGRARRRGHRGPQRRRDARQDDRGHGRGPLEPGDRHQPVQPGADRQPAAGGARR